MAYTTINKSSLHMNTKLYTGNGGTQSITGVGFQPDWVWNKARSASTDHQLFDAVRGTGKLLISNTTDAEYNGSNLITAFGTDGFSLGDHAPLNGNGVTFASWNWKANGAGSANTDGSISSTVSVNTTSGFSIVKYTGTGSIGTIGHGLGAVPKMIITKPYSTTGQWYTYHASLNNTHYLDLLSTSSASDDAEMWNDTSPTSSVFTVGVNGNTNGNGKTTLAYCFAEKTGYSKFGSYVGNGSSNGTFVYTGFKPAWVMTKASSSNGQSWHIQDNKRDGFNYNNHRLFGDSNSSESTASRMDLLSNGFKYRDGDGNGNAITYIYMAFAEAPLVGTNGVTAKAR